MKKYQKKGLGNPLIVAQAARQTAKGVPTFVWIAGIGIAAFVVYKIYLGAAGVFEKIGLKDDANDKAVQQYSNTSDYNAFNPNYYSTIPPGSALIRKADADERATKIWDAFYFFGNIPRANDIEEQVYGTFNELDSKAKISQVTKSFYDLHQQDLFTFLKGKMSSAEMVNIFNIIHNKKNY